jgi:ubiquinone biosynthesis protein
MQQLRNWPGSLWRFCAIWAVTLAALGAYGVLRLGSLAVRDPEARRSRVSRIRGKLLRWAMTTLGATFIKLGQVMSTRPDLFPPEIIDELRVLQDRLPPFPFKAVRRMVEGDLGGALDDHFQELDPEPVAAASVAQVHRGRTKDGAEVAVKVLRPRVRARAERDGVILVGMAKLLELSKTARLSKPVEHLGHFVQGIISQTDLRIEAAHYRKFRQNFEGFKGIFFPRVFESLCGERVLTMEFVRGIKIDKLPPGAHPEVAPALSLAFLKMCFEDGFVHADLHPGNMLVTPNGEVAIFDVGLAKQLEGTVFDQFVDFSRCIAMGTTDDLMRHFQTFHAYMVERDWDRIRRDADAFVTKWRGRKMAEIDTGVMFQEILALARRHHIQPTPEITLVIVGMVTSEGVGKMLNPHLNNFQEMAKFLTAVAMKRAIQKAASSAPAAPA